MAPNWPLLHASANEEGSHIAVAGQRGLVIHNLRSKKWRLFGDVQQERGVRCEALLWLGSKVVVVCNHDASTDR